MYKYNEFAWMQAFFVHHSTTPGTHTYEAVLMPLSPNQVKWFFIYFADLKKTVFRFY